MEKACYRSLHRWKYQLVGPYSLYVGIPDNPGRTDFLDLDAEGVLTIEKGYAWDGPSGPTIDTLSFMRGSLIHDALYQLMRLRKLPESSRITADKLLRTICRKDGMRSFRAWYVYQAVRLFAGASVKPGTEKEDTITCVPSESLSTADREAARPSPSSVR